MDTIFPGWEQAKKDKHGRNCHYQWKKISPFYLSVDGMISKETQFILITLSRLMAAKMEEPISYVKGWVN